MPVSQGIPEYIDKTSAKTINQLVDIQIIIYQSEITKISCLQHLKLKLTRIKQMSFYELSDL